MKLSRIIGQQKICYLLLLVTCLLTTPAFSLEEKNLLVKHKCASCHKVSESSPRTIDETMALKAPDLFYAGSKFNKDWLLEYIQNPVTIRPAGVVYLRNVTTVNGQDIAQKPPSCQSKLNLEEARAVAKYLMTLKDSGIKAGIFHKQSYTKFMIEMTIFRQLACNGCHVFPGKGGGLSGSTFEGIALRLNPDWMVSVIKNPQAHDPWTWMPRYEINDQVIQKIVSYLISMK